MFLPNVGKPNVEKPHVDNPHVENRSQVNTNKQNTNLLNTKMSFIVIVVKIVVSSRFWRKEKSRKPVVSGFQDLKSGGDGGIRTLEPETG